VSSIEVSSIDICGGIKLTLALSVAGLVDITKRTHFMQQELMMKLMLAAARWKISTT